jgi:uncharacterized protein
MAYSNQPLNTSNYYSYVPVPSIQSCTDPRACKLKVEGRGSTKVRPDIAVVVLGVVTENKQLKLAQDENATRMTAVLGSLRENAIPMEDIQTQSYNIVPQYDYIEGKQVFRGYRVEHILEVTIRDMTRIGEIIDDAVQSGANQVSSIKFSIANPSAYYQKALNAAVDDALEKARTLGIKLNISVFKVPVQIVEMGYETGVPIIPLMYQAVGTATPIQTGLVEISSRIEAVFAYRPMH